MREERERMISIQDITRGRECHSWKRHPHCSSSPEEEIITMRKVSIGMQKNKKGDRRREKTYSCA